MAAIPRIWPVKIMAARKTSVGEESDQKEQVVDIRRDERAGRQQSEREEIHAAGFS
jgi:hypothetical protein